jgi:hypothetical protein
MTNKQEYRLDSVKAEIENVMKLDASFSAFIANELKEIDAKLFDTKYAELEAFNLVSVDGRMSPGAEQYSYKMWDGRGVAQITSDYSTASPSNNVQVKEYISKVVGIRNSYQISIQEMRASQLAGVPLDTMEIEIARRTIAEGINKIALHGDTTANITGLFNNANVPSSVAASTLAALSTDNAALALAAFVDQVKLQSKGVHKCNRLVLPESIRLALSMRRMGTNNDTSVLEYFLKQRPGIEVIGSFELDTQGAGGVNRALAYEFSPENAVMKLPVAFEVFPEEIRSTFVRREMHARCGGVVFYRPLSAVYLDGI